MTDLPEGLHYENGVIMDAQEHVWVTIHPSGLGDPDGWRDAIVRLVTEALSVRADEATQECLDCGGVMHHVGEGEWECGRCGVRSGRHGPYQDVRPDWAKQPEGVGLAGADVTGVPLTVEERAAVVEIVLDALAGSAPNRAAAYHDRDRAVVALDSLRAELEELADVLGQARQALRDMRTHVQLATGNTAREAQLRMAVHVADQALDEPV